MLTDARRSNFWRLLSLDISDSDVTLESDREKYRRQAVTLQKVPNMQSIMGNEVAH